MSEEETRVEAAAEAPAAEAAAEAPAAEAAAEQEQSPADDEQPAAGGEAETSSPENELAAARAEAAANYDRYLRSVAELDNYRKRTVKMRSEAREETLRDVLLQIAPILDNLRRALGQDTEDAAALKQGVELISGQFSEVLKGYGLAEIAAAGQAFDPNRHEALAEVPSADCEPGTVMEEMEKGYTLNDKVVRPSRVVVSKASEES
jgi:molecular chaperone GrpE